MSLELDKSCILVYSYLMHMRALEHLGVSDTEGKMFWSIAPHMH